MQAWQITGQGEPEAVMALGEVAVPEPAEGEVQIRVGATGVGLPDVLMCRGEYLFSPPLPFTPGQEVAGVISAVPAGSRYAVGDRVLAVTAFYNGHGGYAAYCLAPEGAVYPIPDGMTDAEAAGFSIPYHTAWVGLCLRGQLAAGETALVLGAAGSSGSAALQLARAVGAKVIAAASSAGKRHWCEQLGADETVDSSAANWPEQVLYLSGGRGVDVVFDPVGGEVCEQALNACAVGARILAVGFASGRWATLPTETLVLKHAALMGVYVGACTPEQMGDCHGQLSQLVREGKIRVPIGERFVFDQVPAALTALADRGTPGKLVVIGPEVER